MLVFAYFLVLLYGIEEQKIMKTNLPFSFPMITHVPFDNCLLGILQNYPNTYDWIYSHFINVYINKNNGADYFFPKFLWNICPFIDTYTIPYIFVRNAFNRYTDFLEICLKDGFYVYSLLNMRPIHKYKAHRDDDHNPIITNIDTQSQTVQMYDFFCDGIYSMYECSYSEINEAFYSLPQCKGFNVDDYLNNYSEIILLRYNSEQTYAFNPKIFKQNIIDFLNCTNLLSEYNSSILLENNIHDSFYWGMESWRNMFIAPMTRRHFSLLLAHSKMWSYRYQYFVEKKYLNTSDYVDSIICDLNSTAQTALNLYLREFIRQKEIGNSNFQRIYPLLEKCESLEHEICEYFLSNIIPL